MENACLVYLRPAYTPSMRRARRAEENFMRISRRRTLNDSLFWNAIFTRDINENESNVELMVS